jgi:hypothetical protein
MDAPQINNHVTAMARYVPTGAASDQLYDEHVAEHPFALETQSLKTLSEMLAEAHAPPTVIFLTGDAGHGKTYMCRRVLTSVLGISTSDAFEWISGVGGPCRADGSADFGRLPSGNQLRIVKDLSDFDIESGRAVLSAALGAADRTTIVCANEGRLRVALLHQKDDHFEAARAGVNRALADGTTRSGALAVLDLNKQAVAGAPNNLVHRVLEAWAGDGRRWRACGTCTCAPTCPIRANRMLLGDDAGSEKRRSAFSSVIRLAEAAGTVVTVRDMIATVALALTGGITCSEVHKKQNARYGWQAQHMFFEVLFGHGLRREVRRQMRLIHFLSTVDPGRVALRAVDDDLVVRAEGDGSPVYAFWPVDPVTLDRAARSAKEAARLAEDERTLVRFLRRAAVFDVEDPSAIAERMGFQFAREFTVVAQGQDPSETVDVRNRLLAGLEVIQGLRRPASGNRFMIVDPAFGSNGVARVIARAFSSTEVSVRSASETWQAATSVDIADAVDWVDRRVILAIGRDGHQVAIGLVEFEFLMRASRGMAVSGFFEGTVRRLRAGLARIADGATAEDAVIRVAMDGDVREVLIDVDGRLVSGEG